MHIGLLGITSVAVTPPNTYFSSSPSSFLHIFKNQAKLLSVCLSGELVFYPSSSGRRYVYARCKNVALQLTRMYVTMVCIYNRQGPVLQVYVE